MGVHKKKQPATILPLSVIVILFHFSSLSTVSYSFSPPLSLRKLKAFRSDEFRDSGSRSTVMQAFLSGRREVTGGLVAGIIKINQPVGGGKGKGTKAPHQPNGCGGGGSGNSTSSETPSTTSTNPSCSHSPSDLAKHQHGNGGHCLGSRLVSMTAVVVLSVTLVL